MSYRIVGGMAVFIHVSERDPLRARLTSDVDAAIDRKDLPTVIATAEKAGWAYRPDLVRMKLASFRLKDRVHIPGSRRRGAD